jgi:hypothetical protein
MVDFPQIFVHHRYSLIVRNMQKLTKVFSTAITWLAVAATSWCQTPDRIAVISGGGAYGAWGAGLCRRLHEVEKHDYKVVVGTSTGSLMAPLVLLNKYTLLETAYTSVSHRDIFSVNPFKSDGSLRGLVVGWRFLFNNTLGETQPLRRLIQKWYTQSDYDAIRQQGKELVVTVANMVDGEPYYMSSNIYDYDDHDPQFGGKHSNWNSMVNWIWASANEPVFMSIFKTYQFDPHTKQRLLDKTGNPTRKAFIWQDGGITQAVSLLEGLQKASEYKILNVDVIVHGTMQSQESNYCGHGTFTGLKRTIEILSHTVKFQNIQTGILQKEANKAGCTADTEKFTITIYYIRDAEYGLLPDHNELVFDQGKMKQLFDAGYAGKFDSASFAIPVAQIKELRHVKK